MKVLTRLSFAVDHERGECALGGEAMCAQSANLAGDILTWLGGKEWGTDSIREVYGALAFQQFTALGVEADPEAGWSMIRQVYEALGFGVLEQLPPARDGGTVVASVARFTTRAIGQLWAQEGWISGALAALYGLPRGALEARLIQETRTDQRFQITSGKVSAYSLPPVNAGHTTVALRPQASPSPLVRGWLNEREVVHVAEDALPFGLRWGYVRALPLLEALLGPLPWHEIESLVDRGVRQVCQRIFATPALDLSGAGGQRLTDFCAVLSHLGWGVWQATCVEPGAATLLLHHSGPWDVRGHRALGYPLVAAVCRWSFEATGSECEVRCLSHGDDGDAVTSYRATLNPIRSTY